MQWIDPYSKMYQIANGFPVTVLSKPNNKKAYFSMKPTTRAAYDLSMRENSIDGIITMKESFNLKAGNVFYIDTDPLGLYIIQSCSYWEQQPDTRNINAVKSNCKVTIQRFGFRDKTSIKEEWYDIHTDVYGFISETLKDSKNFNAGLEVNTLKTIQIPRIDIDEKFYDVMENDRIIVTNLLNKEQKMEAHVESVDSFGVQGIIRMQCTQDIRND